MSKIFVPKLPSILVLSRYLRDNELVRKTLIYDEKNIMKPRLTWYNPCDSWVPKDWFKEGLIEDFKYYFGKSK